MHLIGAEEVSRAANRMSSAADEMLRAASAMDETFRQQRQYLEDWMMRFESALQAKDGTP